MKHRLILLLVIIFSGIHAQAQTGTLSGIVSDERKAPVTGAIIEVIQNGTKKGSAQTDINGRYSVKSLRPGHYEVKARYTGYKIMTRRNVGIAANRTTNLDIQLQVSAKEIQEVVITEYKVPLIKKDKPATSTTITSEQIMKMPVRNTADVTSLSRSTYQQPNGTAYIADGIQVNRQAQYYNPSEESYDKIQENDFMNVKNNPLSTLSVDVDRASYSNVRRFLINGQMPPADAVRIEEMINYFDYNYPQPKGEDPIAITTSLTECPWNSDHQLLQIGMQARKIRTDKLPASNLVFLIDVSGSMQDVNKLPLVVSSLKMLTRQLRPQDKVAIVVYAGNAGLVLPSTSGRNKAAIIDALEALQAGGSTAGGAGIQLAYKVALENFIEEGNNRVILATDGDFNVGVSSDNELEDLITKERKKGIFLTCLGYGMGNYKDSKMEMLADKGNGNYAYIDNEEEARKTLVHEFGGTLFTVAKDVKAQIEFNPGYVQSYRLVGYENRLLNEEDFKDDKKDAGEMGSGHQVTILYEIIPAGNADRYVRKADPLKYQAMSLLADHTGEFATIKFRYKKPDGFKSKEMVRIIPASMESIDNADDNVRFASSVALFGMLLRQSKFNEEGTYRTVLNLARQTGGADENGYRSEYVHLVKLAQQQLSSR